MGDLLLAAVLILIMLPLAALVLVCLAIKLDSAGPMLSRQLLLDADGRLFQML
jgi:lipopolysaccharide/colanic/teichoic acid biosynthesis glycosyltransferase